MVWDYSLENIKVLNARGISNTYHVPLGYDETMESKPPAAAAATAAAAAAAAAAARDIDVVFAGTSNSRRQAKLAQLQGPLGMPLRIGPNNTLLKTDFKGAWGEELAALYRRSKVALNLHCFGGKTILETHRILPIIDNKALVLSEPSDDQWLDNTFKSLVNFTTGGDVRQSVISMLNMDVEKEVERRYQQLLRCCRYLTYVGELLQQPYPQPVDKAHPQHMSGSGARISTE
jgi:hypothetical protein